MILVDAILINFSFLYFLILFPEIRIDYLLFI